MAIPDDFVAHWNMDNISGANLLDEADNYNGSIVGAQPVVGLFGSALDFNGSADLVEMGDVLDMGLLHMSISMWINPSTIPASTIFFLSKASLNADEGRFAIGLTSAGLVRANFAKDTAAALFATSTQALSIDTWYHIAVVFDRGGDLSIYINGVKDGTVDISAHSAVDMQVTTPFKIGAYTALDDSSSTLHFDGKIDQVRVYTDALAQNEITGLARELNQIPNDYLVHYTMDNVVGNELKDESGNHDGVVTGALSTPGVINNALNFTGSPDRVSLGDILNSLFSADGSKFTFSIWIKPSLDNSASKVILGKLSDTTMSESQSQFVLSYINGAVKFLYYGALSGTNYRRVSAGSVVTGEWAHVVVSYDDSVDTGNGLDRVKIYVNSVLEVGIIDLEAGAIPQIQAGTAQLAIGAAANSPNTVSNYHFEGAIDQFRLYDRLLAQVEIETLFTEGSLLLGLQAHYTMDDVSGGAVFDETGGFDLTAVGVTQVDGHLLQALYFDGSQNTDVKTPAAYDSSGDFSISVWFNLEVLDATNGNWILDYRTGSGTGILKGWALNVRTGGNQEIAFNMWNTTNVLHQLSSPINVGQTYHVCVVMKNNTLEMLLDGISIGSMAFVGSRNEDPTYHQVGGRGWNNLGVFHGWIDQLRFYNKALTEGEIGALYYEEILNKILSGTISETLGVTNWHVRSYRIDNGLLTASVDTTDGAFNLEIDVADDVPHLVMVVPDQGTPWTVDTAKTVNQLVYPPDPNATPYYYKVTVAGTTGSSEPTWVTTPGQTLTDGTVTLECVERLVRPRSHSPVIPQ